LHPFDPLGNLKTRIIGARDVLGGFRGVRDDGLDSYTPSAGIQSTGQVEEGMAAWHFFLLTLATGAGGDECDAATEARGAGVPHDVDAVLFEIERRDWSGGGQAERSGTRTASRIR